MSKSKNKKIIFLLNVFIIITLLAGCDSAMSRSKEDVNDIKNIAGNKIVDDTVSGDQSKESLDIIEKLPEEQKNAELDAELADIRKSNKNGISRSSDGSIISFTKNSSTISGQSKNIPDWSKESDEQSLQRTNVIIDYFKNTLKIPEGKNGYNSWTCLDPRMNAIYDEDDKGVANGYENQNIYIEEYETQTADVYSYLILVRTSSTEDWKVIHQGSSYKL